MREAQATGCHLASLGSVQRKREEELITKKTTSGLLDSYSVTLNTGDYNLGELSACHLYFSFWVPCCSTWDRAQHVQPGHVAEASAGVQEEPLGVC